VQIRRSEKIFCIFSAYCKKLHDFRRKDRVFYATLGLRCLGQETGLKGDWALTQRLEERHALIWQHEQVVAYDLAKALIQKPKVTVWIILLPLLFLFFMQDLKKYKNGIRSFVDGFLKNKKIGLDLAYQASQAGSSLDKAVASFAADSRPEVGERGRLARTAGA
jgi:hypothetical protein